MYKSIYSSVFFLLIYFPIIYCLRTCGIRSPFPRHVNAFLKRGYNKENIIPICQCDCDKAQNKAKLNKTNKKISVIPETKTGGYD